MDEYIDLTTFDFGDGVQAPNEGHPNTPQFPVRTVTPELMIFDESMEFNDAFEVLTPLPSSTDSADLENDLFAVDEEDQTVPDYTPSTSTGIVHNNDHYQVMIVDDSDTTSVSSGYSDTLLDERLAYNLLEQRLFLSEYHPVTICMMAQETVRDLVAHVQAMLELIGIDNIPDLIASSADINHRLEFHMAAMRMSFERLKILHRMCIRDTEYHNQNGILPHEFVQLLPVRYSWRRLEVPIYASPVDAQEDLRMEVDLLNYQIRSFVDLLEFLRNEFVAVLSVLENHGE